MCLIVFIICGTICHVILSLFMLNIVKNCEDLFLRIAVEHFNTIKRMFYNFSFHTRPVNPNTNELLVGGGGVHVEACKT